MTVGCYQFTLRANNCNELVAAGDAPNGAHCMTVGINVGKTILK